MIKTILVPVSGGGADDAVFSAALAIAAPLSAHMAFFHVRLTACEAAVRSPHAQYCVGAEINVAFEDLRQQEENLSLRTTARCEAFCAVNGIAIRSSPGGNSGVSASLLQETDHMETRLMYHARHSDLVVMGRSRTTGLMPRDFTGKLLMCSGRPILIAPSVPRLNMTNTIVVGWKETSEAVHAIAAAMPLLGLARRIVLVHIVENDNSSREGLNDLVKQLAWHNVTAETRFLVGQSTSAQQLRQAALEVGADLLVIGGYGHKPLREAIFGGVTREFIEGGELPVFLMH